MRKGLHEEFTRFFENPTRQRLLSLLEMNYGEQDRLDFKRDWPTAGKVARHILALGNSGGGCLVFGVAELPEGGFEPVGLPKLEDKADVAKKLERYLPDALEYEVLDFYFDEDEHADLQGKTFQVMLVKDEPQLIPFAALAGDGEIRENAIYVREGTNSREADYGDLQELIDRRIAVGRANSSGLWLDEQLSVLSVLYSNMGRHDQSVIEDYENLSERSLCDEDAEESYEDFIARLIRLKKEEILKFVQRDS